MSARSHTPGSAFMIRTSHALRGSIIRPYHGIAEEKTCVLFTKPQEGFSFCKLPPQWPPSFQECALKSNDFIQKWCKLCVVRGGRFKSLIMQCTEHKQDARMDFFSQLSDRRTGLRGTVEMHVESLQLCPISSDSGKALERTPKAVVRSTMQNMITLTCWESQPPLENHFVLYRRGNKTAKLCQALVTQEKQKKNIFCLATCNFVFPMVYFINLSNFIPVWSIIHLLLFILASRDLVCILAWCIFVIILFSCPCLKGNKPVTRLHNS